MLLDFILQWFILDRGHGMPLPENWMTAMKKSRSCSGHSFGGALTGITLGNFRRSCVRTVVDSVEKGEQVHALCWNLPVKATINANHITCILVHKFPNHSIR